MKKTISPFLVLGAVALSTGAAFARSPDYMIEDCRLAAQAIYHDLEGSAEATLEDREADGTQVGHGTIYLENRSAHSACLPSAKSNRFVEFVAYQKSRPDVLSGVWSLHQEGRGGSVTAVSQKITTERVRFPSGSSSIEFPAQLPPGMTVRYQLGARNGQFLDVRISPTGAPLTYRILNPDGSALLDELPLDKPYRGQLWQSGSHVVEVINRTGSTVPFNIYFGIK
jgi:hypothetical protein